MNKIKIPKNWEFKYFEVEDNTTKFVYEDQYHNEHIYIDEKPEPELPTYEELQERIDKAELKLLRDIEYLTEQKERLMEIITPETGYLKAELEYKIKEKEELLDILEGTEE